MIWKDLRQMKYWRHTRRARWPLFKLYLWSCFYSIIPAITLIPGAIFHIPGFILCLLGESLTSVGTWISNKMVLIPPTQMHANVVLALTRRRKDFIQKSNMWLGVTRMSRITTRKDGSHVAEPVRDKRPKDYPDA